MAWRPKTRPASGRTLTLEERFNAAQATRQAAIVTIEFALADLARVMKDFDGLADELYARAEQDNETARELVADAYDLECLLNEAEKTLIAFGGVQTFNSITNN